MTTVWNTLHVKLADLPADLKIRVLGYFMTKLEQYCAVHAVLTAVELQKLAENAVAYGEFLHAISAHGTDDITAWPDGVTEHSLDLFEEREDKDFGGMNW